MSYSSTIDALVAAAELQGNRVAEVSTGWEMAREVVHMALPINDDLLRKTRSEGTLTFWSFGPTPHDSPTLGFTDEAEKVAISFPR